MKLNYGGCIGMSTVDYPGHAAVVVFFRGCDKRCSFCQNKHLQTGSTPVDIEEVKQMLTEAAPFVSAAVFSGGEPLLQPAAVIILSHYAHKLGLKVGLHTSLPDELEKIKHLIDYALISDSNRHPTEADSHTTWRR